MSGFDEEAERERLREKYERDREKRTATQRMSELLLKGATMTNRHCDVCGDPIFRHDDQEFCPTCQAVGQPATEDAAAREDDATDADAGAGDGDATGADASTGRDEASGPDASADASAGRDDATSAGDASGSDADLAANAAGSDLADGAATDAPAPTPDASRRTASKAVEGRPERGSPAGAAEDLTEVRASLSRTLARYARAAEETDDPRRAKELLGAAREAAETLAALDRR